MTDRHSVNTINSDALDALYDRLDRIRAELDRIEDFAKRRDDSTTVPYLDAVDALRAVLDQPAPAATEATEHHYLSTGCLHDQHDYCSNVDGIAGLKKPAQCKFCTAPCQCPCHTTPKEN